MPLVSSTMEPAILSALSSQEPSISVAQKIAMAYDSYGRTALAAASTPVLTGAELTAFQQLLVPAFSNSVAGSPVEAANAFANALEAYWFLPPVVFAGSQAGAVTAVPGKAAIIPSLVSLFSNTTNTTPVVANGIATALHTATLTVTVALAPPPGTIVTLL